MLGKPVPVVIDGENVIQVCATDLGFPRGQYPNKLRMRDENGAPRWFVFRKNDAQGIHYVSEPAGFAMIVYPDWGKS